MIQSIAEMKLGETSGKVSTDWVKHWEKLARQVDGRRGGGTRKSRRN